jgi:diguanylate cyclase (GGDEF)-like protein
MDVSGGAKAVMPGTTATRATDEDRAAAQGLVHGIVRRAFLVVVALAALASVFATLVVDPLLSGAPLWQQAVAEALGIIVFLPIVLWFTIVPRVMGRGIQIRSEALARERELLADSARRDLDTRLGRAMELAESESAALDVIERGFVVIAPTTPTELLLANARTSSFERAAEHAHDGTVPSCPVTSPDACPATKRSATLVFEDSDAVDACPRLRDRATGPCSAVCVPVAVMGHTVGVVHAIGEPGVAPDADVISGLQTLANQAGNRLGLLRMMNETRKQAATDPLTGLANRRQLEHRLRELVGDGTRFSLVMADLDHFKLLNDTHGHDAGDRALQLFSRVLGEGVRDEDLLSRWGGEEFTMVLPGVDADAAVAATERIREALAIALVDGTAPRFTASFGVAETVAGSSSFEDLVRRADQALYAAKEAGRNRTMRAPDVPSELTHREMRDLTP